MAATLAASLTVAENPTFVDKVRMAIVRSAIDIQAEDPPHPNRSKLAYDVLRDPSGFGTMMAYGVAVNPVITINSSEDDIQFTVNSVWDAYAGVL